ncbi:DUF3331 domain protein, partial [Medicago truncatula]
LRDVVGIVAKIAATVCRARPADVVERDEQAGYQRARGCDCRRSDDFVVRACTGRYGYQKWRLHSARKRSTCVLSRQPIEIGGGVCTQQLRGSPLGSAAAMVLACIATLA